MYVALTKAKSLRLISYASDRYDEKRMQILKHFDNLFWEWKTIDYDSVLFSNGAYDTGTRRGILLE